MFDKSIQLRIIASRTYYLKAKSKILNPVFDIRKEVL